MAGEEGEFGGGTVGGNKLGVDAVGFGIGE
jgi:hypothetical protein